MNQGIYGLQKTTAAMGPFGPNGAAVPTTIKALILGGGGSGGMGEAASGTAWQAAGGGGAGQFLEITSTVVQLNTAYTITIGAGGTAPTSNPVLASSGNASRFGSFIAIGGGAGGCAGTVATWPGGHITRGRDGSSGGGGMRAVRGGFALISGGGNDGGSGINSSSDRPGGGGGAGAVGGDGTSGSGGTGGNGKSSSIPVTPTTYCGGGGGATTTTTVAAGGTGGGGSGASNAVNAGNGTANTGSGGGGGYSNNTRTAGNGGSGLVILRFNSALLFTVGAGLTYTSEISGSDRILTFTAGTDTITFT